MQASSPMPPLSLDRAARLTRDLRDNVERAIRGKTEHVLKAIVCLVARGHLLLDDVPGVGKTTLARALSRSVAAGFHRIQFTSDLLPSDLTGLSVPEMQNGAPSGRFVFKPGPLFANVVLADEVNRASPKSQSALLEAMSEGTVSVDGVTHPLPDPFFVIATQNPLEHYGTHPLPESQLDRFLMRLTLGYPAKADEADILRAEPHTETLRELGAVIDVSDLQAIQSAATHVKVDDSLIAYLLALVEETRNHEALELGASTRGALALRRTAQARALVDGRDFCIPEDVAELTVDVLSHRVIPALEGGVRQGADEAGWVLREILERTPVPL